MGKDEKFHPVFMCPLSGGPTCYDLGHTEHDCRGGSLTMRQAKIECDYAKMTGEDCCGK